MNGKAALAHGALHRSVANIGRFILRLDLIERQYPDSCLSKNILRNPLMQHHVALHMAAGLVFAAHLGGPTERLL